MKKFKHLYGFDIPRKLVAEEIETGRLYWLTLNDRTLRPQYWIYECVPLEPKVDTTKVRYAKLEEVEGLEGFSNR